MPYADEHACVQSMNPSPHPQHACQISPVILTQFTSIKGETPLKYACGNILASGIYLYYACSETTQQVCIYHYRKCDNANMHEKVEITSMVQLSNIPPILKL